MIPEQRRFAIVAVHQGPVCYSLLMKLALAGTIFALAILGAGCVEKVERAQAPPPPPAPAVESTEPVKDFGVWADFSFKTTAGKTVSLADYRGKVLLVDVWSYT